MIFDREASGTQDVAQDAGAVTASLQSVHEWPLPEAVLTVTDAKGVQVARVQADDAGVVTTPGLSPGNYTAIVTALGYQPLARTAVVPQGRVAELGVLHLERVGGADLPAAGVWRIDPVHSSIRATVQHLGIGSIHGRLNEFGGEVRVGDPIESSNVDVRIEAASVDTANAARDEHLRNADFLDVERYPTITFVSTGLTPRGDNRWDLDGELTLCGVTRQVRLDTRFTGVGSDPWGGTRASATATTRLRRDDFAMNFNQALSTGIAAIGTTLRIDIDIQAVHQE
ncbi:YceI family protein [Haloactinomyces albus]|uniref:Polyisoprenoid-binding protein YceI n=1 Tax=Haloactinomyces albus TaxID=1352928 RepID=A0AAE3ZF45_9ACTN|nr:YceI family protein [Haloactinomyces albus]MDR7302107.1 polyisoprenoid-binding protein YceI [Haloactinomyces albus]